jgi:hypothetical protein
MLVAILLVVSIGWAERALAQASVDTPILRVVATSRVSAQLEVVAGASGAPSGFTLEWMKQSDLDRLGGWPDYADPALVTAVFYGLPTLNPSTGSYTLPANGPVQVEVGDLFDETGVRTNNLAELPSGEDYVFRVRAQPAGGLGASTYSPESRARTIAVPPVNCTYSPGYWKGHPEAWPVGFLLVGTVGYSAAQLRSILDGPAHGNGLVILAHQVIAARLSIASGADPSPVSAALAQADALIGSLVVPPVGGGSLDPDLVLAAKDLLDSYNNGRLGVPHCGATRARPVTWGTLKAIYR